MYNNKALLQRVLRSESERNLERKERSQLEREEMLDSEGMGVEVRQMKLL